MSYLRYFALANTSAQLRTGSSVFGDTGVYPQAEATIPAIRVAAFACLDGEETAGMGLWTVLRHLLRMQPGVEVYPAYYDLQTPGVLSAESEFEFFSEIKNQLTMSGVLEKADNVTLHVKLSGFLVKEGSQIFSLESADVLGIANALPGLAAEISTAFLNYQMSASTTVLTPMTDVADLETLWDLEDMLLSSLYDPAWEEDTFVTTATELMGRARELSITTAVLASIIRDALLPPFSLGAGSVLTLSESGLESEQPSLAFSVTDALIRSGRSSIVMKSLPDDISGMSRSLQQKIIEAALYDNHYHRAVLMYQSLLAEKQEGQLLVAYAGTLRSLLQTERLNSDIQFVLTDTEDVSDEILAAYRRAYELQPDTEVLQDILSFESSVSQPLSADIAEKLLRQDEDGTLVEQVIALLPEDEDIITLIDQLEAEADTKAPDDRVLMALASLYLAVGDPEAAAECLADVSNPDVKGIKQLNARIQIPDSALLISEMSQRLIAGQRLTDEEVDTLEAVLALNNENEDAYQVLAQGYVSRNDVPAATEVLDDALNTMSLAAFVVQKAQILWDSDQHSEAVETILTGLGQFPYDSGLLARLALFLFEADRPEEARSYLRKAEMSDPASTELVRIRNLIGNTLSRE